MADTDQVLKLAAIIREVDGDHSKGAAALAELILDHPSFHQCCNEPAPPADGEVAECAAELLQRQALVPVAASERLPEPSTKVLAHYVNDLGKGRTICAIWVPAKTRIDEGGHDDFTEYDEEDDKFYWPEGWYEAIENWDELGYVKVYEGEVDYWQPLPKRPAHALSLAEVDE
jgi:hypothetical protein